MYDRETRSWVEKKDFSGEKKKEQEKANEEIKVAESKFTSEQPVTPAAPKVEEPVVSAPDDDDDLPF